MKRGHVDRDWFRDADAGVVVQLRTEKALENITEQRAAEARARIDVERKQTKARHSRSAVIARMYPIAYWAEMLDVEPDAVRNWCKSGELQSQWLRNEWRVTEKAMQEFLDKENRRRVR